MEPILTLTNVTYQYKGSKKPVLCGIDMEFQPSTLHVIMGKSGAGKSTLLSLLSGLDLPTKGEILYEGQDIRKLDRDNYRARSIGTVFQSYNLLTNATAIENIILSMNISKEKSRQKKEYALGLLSKMGIDEETARRKIRKLSGGEQQRVGIARALSHDPNVIIADEPTGNLDGEKQETIMNIFRELAHEEKKCVIVVTHSKEVSKYADETWGMNQGNLVFIK